MADKKEWRGITINESTFLGKVVEDPTFADTGDGNECAFMSLKAYTNELAQNGQWVETETVIPLIVMDTNKVKTVRNHVQKDRELMVKAYYKSWDDPNHGKQHGFVVMLMRLGSKPYVPKTEDADGRVPLSAPQIQ